MKINPAISATEYLNTPKWYIIVTISGNEESVVNSLKGKIASYGYSDRVEDIRIIKEKVVTIEEYSADKAPSNVGAKLKNAEWKTIEKNGKVHYQLIRTEERNKFNGYIFIKMFMDEQIWFIIRNTQLVTGIVGSSGKNTKPIPVSNEEIERILNFEEYDPEEVKKEIIPDEEHIDIYKDDNAVVIETIKYTADFNVGDRVKIIGGDMVGDVGYVVSMNNSKGIAVVEVEIFNRMSRVEVNYSNLERYTE